MELDSKKKGRGKGKEGEGWKQVLYGADLQYGEPGPSTHTHTPTAVLLVTSNA